MSLPQITYNFYVVFVITRVKYRRMFHGGIWRAYDAYVRVIEIYCLWSAVINRHFAFYFASLHYFHDFMLVFVFSALTHHVLCSFPFSAIGLLNYVQEGIFLKQHQQVHSIWLRIMRYVFLETVLPRCHVYAL